MVGIPGSHISTGGLPVKDNLQSILENWGMQNLSPVPASGAGAAIAAGVWHLNEQYSLKTGSNFEGLKKHIDISRVLQDNGISASCPLPALDGQDFITVGDRYYVITERIMDNFLSTAISDPARDDEYFSMYAAEIKNFKRAMEVGDPELSRILARAAEEAAAIARARGMDFTGKARRGNDAGSPTNGFFCGTRFRMSISDLLTRLDARGNENAAVHMLYLFVAWTDGREIFNDLIHGNLSTAFMLKQSTIPPGQ